MAAEVDASVVIVPLVEVRLVAVSEPVEMVVIPADVPVSVVTVALVEVRFVAVSDPLVSVVMSPLL